MWIYLALGFLGASLLLALHHWYIHYQEPPEDGKGHPCLLQPKDFCVFTRGTHETPILLLFLLAMLAFVLAATLP